MAGDAFQKFGDSMNRAFTKISVKTSSSLEKSKIKLHIDTINKDIQKTYYSIGEDVYALWLKGEISNQTLTERLELIKSKNNEIQKLSDELVSIDERDNEILGTKEEGNQAPTPASSQTKFCPDCSIEYEDTAKFCRKCGRKL